MAIHTQTSGIWLLSIKIILISTTVLSMAVMIKLSLPVIMEFVFSEVPSICSFVISWLRPPYLYVVINCIIVTIVASSRLQLKVGDPLLASDTAVLLQTEPVKVPADVRAKYAVVYEGIVSKNEEPEVRPEFENCYGQNFLEVSALDVYGHVDAMVSETKTTVDTLEAMSSGNEFGISKSSSTALDKDPMDFSFPTEKPSVSARFGHRKSVKAGAEGGRTLGVAKPKRQDTLESTWKTITDGRPMPLTRHLRKSDTWETHGRHHSSSQEHQDQRMTKSETFNVDGGGRDNHHNNNSNSSLSRSTGSGKLRKDPSLSQDELNRRVEAFIKKVNEEMRLRRQESLNQFMEMINRGAH